MNSWIFIMIWMCARFFSWFSTFSPSERVALAASFLVLVGVIGEYVVEEVGAVKNREWLGKRVKWLSMALLVLGLTGDVLGIVMGQAEMAALTKQAGDAAKSAHDAAKDAGNAKGEADDVAKQTVALTTRLGEASKQLSDIEFRTLLQGPRANLVAGERKNDLIKALKPFSGRSIDVRREALIGSMNGLSFGTRQIADEASGLKSALLGVLKDAGWKLPAPSDRMFWLAGNGISVRTFPNASPATRKAAAEVVKAFSKVPLSATVGPDITADDVRIRMGAEEFDPDVIILVIHPK